MFISKIKSFLYILKNDKNSKLLKHFLKSPFRFIFLLIKAFFNKLNILEDEGILLFGIKDLSSAKKEFEKAKTKFIGISFCARHPDCFEKKFSEDCSYKNDYPCSECFIRKLHIKCSNTTTKIQIITTVNQFAEKLFENPKNKFFIVAACHYSIKMFSIWYPLTKSKGIVIPLEGKTCKNFITFKAAENGKKNFPTFISLPLQEKILSFLE